MNLINFYKTNSNPEINLESHDKDDKKALHSVIVAAENMHWRSISIKDENDDDGNVDNMDLSTSAVSQTSAPRHSSETLESTVLGADIESSVVTEVKYRTILHVC